MSCDVSETDHAARPNHTSPPVFHHLDATLFYSAAPSDVSELPDAVRRAGYDQSYSVDSSVAGLRVGSLSYPVFALSDVTDGVDAELLRTVFVLSDIVVLVYRLTATYVTVRALRRRFNVGRCPSSCQADRLSGQMVTDGGSMLRCSSSRTALTSTAVPGVVPDMSDIYIDPQSLVVENCATVIHRQDDSMSCPRRRSDIKYPPGRLNICSLHNR